MTDKVKTITKSELTRIEEVISNLITETLESDLGIEFRFTRGQYSNQSTGNLKMELNVKGGLTQEELLLENSWSRFGLVANPRGCEMFLGGRNWVVIGLVPRARNGKDFIVENMDSGEHFRMTAEQVCMGLHNQDPNTWPAKPWEGCSVDITEKKGEWSK